ncbi:MAG: M48 family peptidase, partial [Parafilimonas sp.]
MKLKVALLFFVLIASVSCSRNAITGRNQLNLVSEDQMEQMSLTQYKQFLSESKVISSDKNN